MEKQYREFLHMHARINRTDMVRKNRIVMTDGGMSIDVRKNI